MNTTPNFRMAAVLAAAAAPKAQRTAGELAAMAEFEEWEVTQSSREEAEAVAAHWRAA